jgi:hypothetical protein
LGSTKVAVPWQAFQIVNDRSKLKYLLDATKERFEKAPRGEGKNYDRLYAADTPSQSSSIGTLSSLRNRMQRCAEQKRLRFDGSGRIAGSRFRFSRPVPVILALLASLTVERI